jgi:hypothetical protein
MAAIAGGCTARARGRSPHPPGIRRWTLPRAARACYKDPFRRDKVGR